MIAAFEQVVSSQQISGVVPRSVLYLDGGQVVPLRPETLEAEGWRESSGVRSHAFRIRRGFDEFWFLLHLKPHAGTLGFQLDVKQRNRNFIGPTLLIAVILFPILSWLTGNESVKFGILICVGLAWLHHLGIVEFLFNKERGEKRRTERISEYLPVFVRALSNALQVESMPNTQTPTVITPPVGTELLTGYENAPPTPEGQTTRPRVD